MNIGTNRNFSIRHLLRHYVELYQNPAANIFQIIFAWLLITV